METEGQVKGVGRSMCSPLTAAAVHNQMPCRTTRCPARVRSHDAPQEYFAHVCVLADGTVNEVVAAILRFTGGPLCAFPAGDGARS